MNASTLKGLYNLTFTNQPFLTRQILYFVIVFNVSSQVSAPPPLNYNIFGISISKYSKGCILSNNIFKDFIVSIDLV